MSTLAATSLSSPQHKGIGGAGGGGFWALFQELGRRG